ncbi:MAG: glycosyltransferase family 4 protein [Bacillota bacterium]
MKHSKTVLVLLPQTPFTIGGAEHLALALVDRLKEQGHRAALVSVPFADCRYDVHVRTAMAWRMVDVTEWNGVRIDAVIPLKWPAYLADHPHKVVWLCHQYRGVYDLWDKPPLGIAASPESRALKDQIERMDRATLPESTAIYAISKNVRDRLQRYNGLRAEHLYPPLPREGEYFADDTYDDYILSVGRLNAMKRIRMLVEAFRYTKSPARCLLVGNGPDRPEIEKAIREHQLEHKVKLLNYLPWRDVLQLYARALGVYFAPVDEDYGYITIEAFTSERPVLTATDSGGSLEFVRHGENGFVLPPKPKAFAEAIDRLWYDRSLARKMGREGKSCVAGITWANAIATLAQHF